MNITLPQHITQEFRMAEQATNRHQCNVSLSHNGAALQLKVARQPEGTAAALQAYGHK